MLPHHKTLQQQHHPLVPPQIGGRASRQHTSLPGKRSPCIVGARVVGSGGDGSFGPCGCPLPSEYWHDGIEVGRALAVAPCGLTFRLSACPTMPWSVT